MALTEAQRRAVYKYRQKNIRRVWLDMQIDLYNQLADAANAADMPVNTYIKTAIREKMDRDNSEKIENN